MIHPKKSKHIQSQKYTISCRARVARWLQGQAKGKGRWGRHHLFDIWLLCFPNYCTLWCSRLEESLVIKAVGHVGFPSYGKLQSPNHENEKEVRDKTINIDLVPVPSSQTAGRLVTKTMIGIRTRGSLRGQDSFGQGCLRPGQFRLKIISVRDGFGQR